MRHDSCFTFYALALLITLTFTLSAYPPAPHQLFYGVVRDELGNPLRVSDAEVVLETELGSRVTAHVVPGLAPDANYELQVPMDSGVTSDAYRPSAIRPALPFRFVVRIGDATLLPIEVRGDYSIRATPSQRTRLDLTLGEDTDGDGLPDAWERALLSAKGGTDLLSIDPNGDADGDQLSNLDEYIAGTYAFDPEDAFELKISPSKSGAVQLEFLAITGRTYSILGAQAFDEWSNVPFVIDGTDEVAKAEYHATDVRMMRVELPTPEAGQASYRFFKLVVR